MEISEARPLWNPEPGWLNTATYGLPPQPAWEAMQSALAAWRVGGAMPTAWEQSAAAARDAFARLMRVPAADVAIGSQVSAMLAPVAAALPDGARVLVPEIEFTSNLFPWLVHADRLTVATAPAARLAERVADGCDLVAFSLVQSATGEVADYAGIVTAARAAGATVVVDASQACGWLPFDPALADVVVAGAYKWLMCPRGTAFAYLAPGFRDTVRPISAGWFAGADVAGSYYGPAMTLAADARRFDVSPAWFDWAGAAPALQVLERVGIEAVHRHDVGLANRFLAGLGRPSGDSAIVTLDAGDAGPCLAAAGIRVATRAGRLRAAFHLYTTESEVDRALEALS